MSLVCGRNRSERRMTEYQEASCSEDGCSNWKRTSADGNYRRYAGTCSQCDEDERRR